MVKKDPSPKRTNLASSPQMMEAKNLIEKYKKSKKELEELLENFQKATGLSVEEMKVICNNPKNFSPEQWKKIEAERDQFFQMLSSSAQVLSPKRKKEVAEIVKPYMPKKKGRGQQRAAKKKWILME